MSPPLLRPVPPSVAVVTVAKQAIPAVVARRKLVAWGSPTAWGAARAGERITMVTPAPRCAPLGVAWVVRRETRPFLDGVLADVERYGREATAASVGWSGPLSEWIAGALAAFDPLGEAVRVELSYRHPSFFGRLARLVAR